MYRQYINPIIVLVKILQRRRDQVVILPYPFNRRPEIVCYSSFSAPQETGQGLGQVLQGSGIGQGKGQLRTALVVGVQAVG